MAGRKIVDMNSLFSGAEQIHKLSEAEAEIQRLQDEIQQLRDKGAANLEDQVGSLRDRLKSASGTLMIPVEQIRPNPEQPRQSFSAESIQAMANSLGLEGQLSPVILIQQEDDYLLFDGERRWRGATSIGWDSIEAVLIPQPKSLHRQALLTSLHREDLNPLDKAEALIREISATTALNSEDIPRVLAAASRRLTKQGNLSQLTQAVTATTEQQAEILNALDLNEQEQAIISVLLELQLNPSSVDANIFPMLSLSPDLKHAIRDKGLKGSHAMALQQIATKNLDQSQEKVTQLRQKTTDRVLQENLSVNQTRKLVREILKQQSSPQPKPLSIKRADSLKKAVKDLPSYQLEELDTSDLEELKLLLKHKLSEIENALGDR